MSPGGSILIFATPYNGSDVVKTLYHTKNVQHSASFILEADRYGQEMREPAVVEPWDLTSITASNHFLLYGANKALNENFGQSASFSSLWRYEASKVAILQEIVSPT